MSMTTATLAPFSHATEHPDYIADREARIAAEYAAERARRNLWIWAEVEIEHQIKHGSALTDRDRERYGELRAALDAAEIERDAASEAWWETRVRLGLKDPREERCVDESAA